jgi:hypothetical protein
VLLISDSEAVARYERREPPPFVAGGQRPTTQHLKIKNSKIILLHFEFLINNFELER